jgi:hypothetical protein
MSARKSPTFSGPSPSKLRSQPGRITGEIRASCRGWKVAADGGFGIADFRRPIADLRISPPVGVAHEGAIQGPKRFCQKSYERKCNNGEAG